MRRTPPLFLGALWLAAGIALGLGLSRSQGAQPSLGLLAVLGLLALLASILGRAACQSRMGLFFPSLVILILGGWLGAAAGHTARRACAHSLVSGDSVSVTGRVYSRPVLVREGPTRSVRLTVREAQVRRGSLTCSLPYLISFVDPDNLPAESGLVELTGRWLRFSAPAARGNWPQPPTRAGLLVDATARVHASPPRGFERVRGWTRSRLASRLSPRAMPVALALTLAERDELPPAVRRRFADAGLAHLLAISGLHIGLIAAVVLWLCGRVLHGTRRYLLAALLVGAYVLMIGAPPAASRAWLLFVGYLWTRLRGQRVDPLDLLGAAAVLLLIVNPLWLLDPGFQLSFAGVVGLIMGPTVGSRLAASLSARLATGRRQFEDAGLARTHPPTVGPTRTRRSPWTGRIRVLAASAGALAFTSPIGAAHFGRVAPVALLSNLLAAPVVLAALAALAMTLVLPWQPGVWAGAAADLLLRLLSGWAGIFATLPHGHFSVRPPAAAEWAALALIAALVVGWSRGLSSSRALTGLGGALALLIGAPGFQRLAERGETLLCTVDVGQGDAAVLRTKRGHWLVFDAGPPGSSRTGRESAAVTFLRSKRTGAIDLLILSHPDMDHLGGASGLLQTFDVRRALDSGRPLPRPAYEQFLASLELDGIRWWAARAGDRVRIDEVTLTILAPEGRAAAGWAEHGGSANDSGVSFRLQVGEHFVYVNTGDGSSEQEAALLRRWPADTLRADLLKIGHHGSRNSSSLPWLRTVAPSRVVISSGRGNRYGHPHTATLRRLAAAGIERVWRTDTQGTMCVRIDREGTAHYPS